jgi:cell division protein FtsL
LPRNWWVWGLVLLAMGTAASLHVRSRLKVVHLGYALSEASSQNRKLRAERRKLVLEVATLRSPRRLRKLAVEQLGLVEPGPEQILKVDKRQPSKLALGQ